MNDDRLVGDLRQVLDDSAAELDELTLAGLKAARLRALDATHARPGYGRWPWLAGALASVIAVALVLTEPEAGRDAEPATMAAVAEPALPVDDLELMSELDFVIWLAETETTL